MPKKLKIYGWTEEVEDGGRWDIDCKTIEPDSETYIDKHHKQIFFNGIEGRWFTTFRAAKKAMIYTMTEGIRWRKEVISAFNKIKKTNIIEV
jgi:hypothetical protein